MNNKAKGTICGIIAAVSYGTNPLGALNLYKEGINVNSVLFYRYGLAALVLFMVLFLKKESFKVSRKELKIVALLGLLFATSSLTLFTSFHFMDAGIASTLLFVYPIMVAILMAVFFKEKLSAVTLISITLALTGIALLCEGGDGSALSTVGVILVMVSSLTYALYIILINKAELKMSAIKLTFYVLIFCIATILIYSIGNEGEQIQLLRTSSAWGYAIMLAIVPTIISLITMAIAVNIIGSTATAIMGALEPLTAVIIGVSIFGEQLTSRLMIGIVLILGAVVLIILLGKSIQPKQIHWPQQLRKIRIRHK